MKLKSSFFYTLREDVNDEESISGKLLVKSGMVKKVSSGIYMYMPLGNKIMQNIENIIREEMDKKGANELKMPSLLPDEPYIASGRRNNFGHDMFSLTDRFNRNLVLGPTHEEFFVMAAKEKIKSYKDMPFNIYQIANKYRDEPRPRYGLIRVREFVMKDAYSFDVDNESLDLSYQKMYQAYVNIFNRIGLDYRIVKADTGTMGGFLSEEFQAVTDIGEDTLVICDNCDYASNLEVSECKIENKFVEEEKEKELVNTPSIGSIDDLVNSLNMDASSMVKTLIYKVEDKFYACLIKGDREINELKITKLLKVNEIELASPDEVKKITNAEVGFAGPIDIDIPVIIDDEVLTMKNFLVGANRNNYHYINVNLKDFKYQLVADIKTVKEGDKCPKCGHKLIFKKGIEIGNTFKLGTKYSESLGLEYLDKENNLKPVVMGCYGIGLGRILASLIEQNNDENGMILPYCIAPYKVAIVLINEKDEDQVNLANTLYDTLNNQGIETILDDRNLRAGVKFKDMDLIGIPIRITVGKKASENIVEFKLRNENEFKEVNVDNILEEIEKASSK